MAYNQGKTFNIEAEIDFFLDEAMKAATLAGLIFERFINSFPLTVEAEMVVSSNCNISDPVVFSCAQTEAMHKTGSDMMVINLFLILLF